MKLVIAPSKVVQELMKALAIPENSREFTIRVEINQPVTVEITQFTEEYQLEKVVKILAEKTEAVDPKDIEQVENLSNNSNGQ